MSDYSAFVEKHFTVTLRSGSEWMCSCPKHEDSSASLQFNVERGLFICFSCRWSGSMKTLTREMGVTFRDNVDVEDVLARLDAIDKPVPAFKPISESILRRYDFPTDYWGKRGFDQRTVSRFGLGYDPMADAAIIPARDLNGNLVGVIRRNLSGLGPKYKYPKGFPRRSTMFGAWLVPKSHSGTVVVTEGSLDAAAVWQAGRQGVAQYGSSMTQEQARLIRRMGATRVVLFYDNDEAGRKATDVAVDLLRDIDLRVVRYLPNSPKDPGDMPSLSIQNHVDNAVPLF